MSTIRTRAAISAATITLGLGCGVAGTAHAAAQKFPSSLQVTAVAPAAWPAHSRWRTEVIVRNPDAQLVCSAFDVTLTWAQGGARGELTRVVEDTFGTGTAALTVPRSAMRAGNLRYFVTAYQRCGLLGSTTEYAGRTPQHGSASVHVIGP